MAWDHQNQEDCAILSGWLNKTSLLYIFSDFFLSTGNRANTHRQIYQVDCVYLNIYFFLLSIISVQLQFYLYFLSFFSFFFPSTVHKTVYSLECFTQIVPWACCIQYQTNKRRHSQGVISLFVVTVVGSDVTKSSFNWHLAPFPVRPAGEDGVPQWLKWAWAGPELKRWCCLGA